MMVSFCRKHKQAIIKQSVCYRNSNHITVIYAFTSLNCGSINISICKGREQHYTVSADSVFFIYFTDHVSEAFETKASKRKMLR